MIYKSIFFLIVCMVAGHIDAAEKMYKKPPVKMQNIDDVPRYCAAAAEYLDNLPALKNKAAVKWDQTAVIVASLNKLSRPLLEGKTWNIKSMYSPSGYWLSFRRSFFECEPLLLQETYSEVIEQLKNGWTMDWADLINNPITQFVHFTKVLPRSSIFQKSNDAITHQLLEGLTGSLLSVADAYATISRQDHVKNDDSWSLELWINSAQLDRAYKILQFDGIQEALKYNYLLYK